MIKAIICIGANRVIGKNGTMPWGDKPLDGAHFRSMTEGHTVVMGRKTFESMGSKPLPNRENIIFSRRRRDVPTIEEIVDLGKTEDVWIIGGAQIYKAFVPYIEEWHVTTVGAEFEGDRYMPDMATLGEWNHETIRLEEPNEKCPYHLHFSKFTRKA